MDLNIELLSLCDTFNNETDVALALVNNISSKIIKRDVVNYLKKNGVTVFPSTQKYTVDGYEFTLGDFYFDVKKRNNYTVNLWLDMDFMFGNSIVLKDEPLFKGSPIDVLCLKRDYINDVIDEMKDQQKEYLIEKIKERISKAKDDIAFLNNNMDNLDAYKYYYFAHDFEEQHYSDIDSMMTFICNREDRK